MCRGRVPVPTCYVGRKRQRAETRPKRPQVGQLPSALTAPPSSAQNQPLTTILHTTLSPRPTLCYISQPALRALSPKPTPPLPLTMTLSSSSPTSPTISKKRGPEALSDATLAVVNAGTDSDSASRTAKKRRVVRDAPDETSESHSALSSPNYPNHPQPPAQRPPMTPRSTVGPQPLSRSQV